MDYNDLLKYRVLIIDNQIGPSSFGQITRVKLERREFAVDHVTSSDEARRSMEQRHYDILIVDVTMQATQNGVSLVRELRAEGCDQPIVLATGNENYLDQKVRYYGDVFSLGLTTFFNKNEPLRIQAVIAEIASRVDPLKRALRLMSEAGLGGRSIIMDDGEVLTVDQILTSKDSTDTLARGLRDGLGVLLLELKASRGQGG